MADAAPGAAGRRRRVQDLQEHPGPLRGPRPRPRARRAADSARPPSPSSRATPVSVAKALRDFATDQPDPRDQGRRPRRADARRRQAHGPWPSVAPREELLARLAGGHGGADAAVRRPAPGAAPQLRLRPQGPDRPAGRRPRGAERRRAAPDPGGDGSASPRPPPTRRPTPSRPQRRGRRHRVRRSGDPVNVAKALRDFARTNPALVVKGGLLGENVLDRRRRPGAGRGRAPRGAAGQAGRRHGRADGAVRRPAAGPAPQPRLRPQGPDRPAGRRARAARRPRPPHRGARAEAAAAEATAADAEAPDATPAAEAEPPDRDAPSAETPPRTRPRPRRRPNAEES